MKTISKILSIVLCLTLVLGMAAMVSAAETTATISFADKANRTVFTTSQQVWVQNGITVTNDKASSTNNVADYGNPARFYKGSKLTIASAGMTSILITCNSNDYATALEGSISDTSVTVTKNAKVVTIKLSAATDSYVISSLSAQVRINEITVDYTPLSHTHTWSTTASKVESKNDTHHTNFYPCTDTTCTATNPVDEAHTLVNNECACGYKYVAPTVVDIKDATTKDTSYTVKGVVTLLDGQNIYVQDATGGICVRVSAKPTDLKVGDTIIGTGKRDTYNGLPQLGSATYEKSTGMTLSAKETTIDKLTTADIGTYIKLVNVEVTEVFDNNGAYTTPNITVKDAAGNKIQIYKAVVGKTNGAWDVKVGDKLTVTAAVGVYNTTLQLRNTVAEEIVAYTPPAQTGDTTLSIAVALMAVSAMGIAVVASKKKEF